MSDAEITCGNPDCRVAIDGKCVEGLALDKCQFYGKPPQERTERDSAGDDSQEIEATGVPLDIGMALNKASASSVLALAASRVVGIVGAYDSGKTSILAGLYDLFQEGPVGGIEFAGSSTLHAFEEVCHDARAASKRDIAHSPRTQRGDVRFYHLDLKPVDRDGHLSLLIADRSGEEYEEVADDISHAELMFELRRAETITILIDGARLCAPATRHDAIGSIPAIVQGLREGCLFDRRPQLALVLTKSDAVSASSLSERAMKDFGRMVTEFRAKFSTTFGDIQPFVTAASPKDVVTQRGKGLPELLDFWLRPAVIAQVPREPVQSDRIFSKLQPREE